MFQKKINNTKENNKSSAPFVFGFISGVIAGVLFAPSEGSTTRKNLGKRIKSLVNNLEGTEVGRKVASNPSIIKATEDINTAINTVSDAQKTVVTKATSILSSPIAKKIIDHSFPQITPIINKKTGKKFVSKKK